MAKRELGPGWLRAEDFLDDGKWGQYSLTIKTVDPPGTHESAEGKMIDKPVVSFEETPKRLILCTLNQRLFKYALGTSKVQKWIGQKVTLYAAKGNWFKQKNVAAIRVRIPEEGAHPFVNIQNMGTDLTGVTQRSSSTAS